MPTTPPCPLPTKIPPEPKTQIKEKKKKKTTRSLPHPTHLNPKDKNQSIPHYKTHTKPKSGKPQNPDRRNHLTHSATRSTPPPTSRHIQPIISDLERPIIGNPLISIEKPTNLHQSKPTPPPDPWYTNPPISMPWPRTKPSSSASLEQEREMWDERKSEEGIHNKPIRILSKLI